MLGNHMSNQMGVCQQNMIFIKKGQLTAIESDRFGFKAADLFLFRFHDTFGFLELLS